MNGALADTMQDHHKNIMFYDDRGNPQSEGSQETVLRAMQSDRH